MPGLVFGFTPGQSTSLSGAQNGGVFAGMLTVGFAATGLGHRLAARLGHCRAASDRRLAAFGLALIGPMGAEPDAGR